jgi:hypothetical protein
LTLDLGAGIVTESGQIKTVDKFKCLGSVLENTCAATLEIETRTSNEETGMLNGIVEQKYSSQNQKDLRTRLQFEVF